MLKGQTKGRLVLWSSASLCLLATGVVAPAVSFAQQNDSNLTASLNILNDAQKRYSDVSGMVSEMPLSGLATREKAAQALAQIRSGVIQVRNSDKVPQELLHSALIAIDEAQTALTTDSAQAIAWSLQTVGQEVQAVQAKLANQNPPQTASAERPIGYGGGTQAPDQTSSAKAPEQPEARVAEAEHNTGVTPQAEHGPNANTAKRIAEGQQNGPTQQATPEQPLQKSAQAQQPGQPAPQPSALASMKRDDIVGKWLVDRNGNDVARIADVKTSPDGKIQAAEIDVGGFLGIGARRISVPVDELQSKGDRIEATSMTADEIRNQPHEAR